MNVIYMLLLYADAVVDPAEGLKDQMSRIFNEVI